MLFRLLLGLLCLFPSLASAQVQERSYGLEAGLHQGGRRISAGASVPFLQLERQDSIESGRGGYTVGLLFESRAGKIGFTAGLRYLTTGYGFAETFADGPGFGTDFETEVRAQYLEIPFELNFHQDITERDRVSFMLGVGANVHLGTVTEETTIIEGVRQEPRRVEDDGTEGFRPLVVSLNTGMAYDRKLGDNFAVKVQPYFRFFLQGNLQQDFSAFNRNYFQTGVRLVFKRLVF